jgi:glutamate formiminotransferase / formiminotetrahydrofolate cyclodeaminase
MRLVECVPNFSEGRRPDVVAAIRDAIAAVKGVAVLDVSSDQSHNRTVVTFVAPVENAVDAAIAGMRVARDKIDLNKHTGEHPRMGATDVVPFIPLEGTTMEDCIVLARTLGDRVGRELEIPVFLYERAATTPSRENLADVRRGEFEGIRDEMTAGSPSRKPDFGPSRIHATAGAVAIGARPFLVAYNVYLGPATNLSVAKNVAKAIRGSSGGLRYVKGLGLEVDGQAQVSMNLVDTEKTPVFRAFEVVKMEAEAQGVSPTWSEIVGLVPERSLFETAARHLRLRDFKPEMVLEHKVRQAMQGGESLSGFISTVASPTPTPGGGSVAAHVGALGAALAQMVAGLTVGKKKYAFGAVSAAYKLPAEPEDAANKRKAAITDALLGAAEVPLETARACARVAELAAKCAVKGNTNAVSDAGVAALLADAACRGAVYNVRINIAALEDRSRGAGLVQEANQLLAHTRKHVDDATGAVEKAIG